MAVYAPLAAALSASQNGNGGNGANTQADSRPRRTRRTASDNRGRTVVNGGLRDEYLKKSGGVKSTTVDSRGNNSSLRKEYQRENPNIPTMSTALTDDEKFQLQNAYADAANKYRDASKKAQSIRPEEGLDYAITIERYRSAQQSATEEKAAAESEMDKLRKQLEFYNVDIPDLDQNVFQRTWGALKGGSKQAAGSLGGAAGYTGRVTTSAQNAVDRALRASGNEELSALYDVGTEEENAKAMQMQQSIADKSADISESGGRDIERSKWGASKAGRFALDAVSQVPALAADTAANFIAPGAGMAMMMGRSFGGGVQEAEASGANLAQAGAYGAASAAVESLTEKLTGGLDIAYGKGFTDKVTEKLVGRLAKTDIGRTAFRAVTGAFGEGVEETLSSAINPTIRAIYNGKSIGENYSEEQISDWLYDGLVGAALGLVGQGVNIANGENAKKNAALRRPETEAQAKAAAETQARQQAEAEAQANATRAVLDDILSRGRVNQQQAAQIMNSPEFARMFEALTGRKLEGSTNQQRTEIQQAAREYAYNKGEQAQQAAAERQAAEQTQTEAERALSEYSQQEAARDAEWTERRQQMENYDSYDSYVRGLIRDGMTPAEAGEIARNPQMREAWERLTGQKLPTDSTSRARQMIMETRADVPMPQNQAPVTPQNSVQTLGDISTPPTTSNDVVARSQKLNSAPTADAMVQNADTQKNTAPTGTESTSETVAIIDRLKENIPNLESDSSVAVTSSDSVLQTPGNTMAEKARQLFSKIVGNVSRAGFGDVEINNRSMKDDLSHGIGMAKAAVIPAIPDVIKNGKQIDFQSQWKGRPYDGYVFAAPVDLDGRKVYVAAIVKQTSKNRFYLHEVVDSDGNIIKINGGEKANPTSLSSVDGTGTSSPPITPTQGVNAETVVSNISIPTAEENVNSGQAENSGRERERGFSKNVRTDNAMEADIRQSFDENPESYSQLANKDTLSKAKEIYDKGLPTARSTVEQALGAAKAGQKLAPEMVPLARMVANELSRSGEVESARNILADVATELTAAGQLGQAGRIMRDSDPNTALRSIEKSLEAINDEFSKQHKHSKWKAALTDAEREKILSTDFTEEGAYQSVYEEITKRIGKEMPSSVFEKLTEIRRINMLLRPKTMIKNVVSNVPMVGLRKGAETLSIGIQSALTKMGAMDSVERTRGMASKEQKQLASDFYEANKGDINGQSNKWDMKSMLQQNRTIFKGGAIENAMSKMTGKEIQPFGEALRQVTYDLLEKGDAPFVKSAFVDSLSQYCAAKGITSQDGITREAIDFATANAMEATFKNANLVASLINKVKRESSPGVAMAVDVLIPFTTTPANILTLMGDYSPVGFAKMFAKDGPAAKIDAFSKATVGSAIMALGFALRNADMITGGEDDDKDKAALDKATGRGNYSIGGKVSYDWAQPAGSLLAFGAEIADAIKGQESWDSALMNAIYTAGDSTLNLSLFQNVISVLKGSGKPTQQIIDSIMDGGATQLVPGLAGDIAKIIDGTVRSTYTGGNAFDDTAAKVKAVTPFLSKSLPESVNVKGETNTRGNLAERTFNTLINPFNVTRGKRNEVDEEIYRLYDSTGSKTFFPSVSPYKVEYDNKEYSMDGKDRETFQKIQGQTYYELAKPLLDSEMYKTLNDKQKASVLSSIKDYAFDEAKRQFVDGRGDAYSSDTWDKTSKLESPWEAIVAKAALNDAKDKTKANFGAVDQVLKNFGLLKDDTQALLRDSGLHVDQLLYADKKGVSSEDWFDIYEGIKAYRRESGNSNDRSAAIAINNIVDGTDEEKLKALEAQLTPNSADASKNPGKRNAVVRRYEAAINSGVSYDNWTKVEEALDAVAPGKTPNRDEVYEAAAMAKAGVSGSTAYWIYDKYSSDKSKVEQYDYSYGAEADTDSTSNTGSSKSSSARSAEEYFRALGLLK